MTIEAKLDETNSLLRELVKLMQPSDAAPAKAEKPAKAKKPEKPEPVGDSSAPVVEEPEGFDAELEDDTVTKADVFAALKQLKKDKGREICEEILQEFGAPNVSGLADKHYREVLDRANQEMA